MALAAALALFGCGGRSARTEQPSNSGPAAGMGGGMAGTGASGGSTEMASGGASGDERSCTKDADCKQCLYVAVPMDPSECEESLGCCGGQVLNETTCTVNQAAFQSVCAGQTVSVPLCPCIAPGTDCPLGCKDGECGFHCNTPSNAGGAPAR